MLTVFDQWDLVRAHILHRGQPTRSRGEHPELQRSVESFSDEVIENSLRLTEIVAFEASKLGRRLGLLASSQFFRRYFLLLFFRGYDKKPRWRLRVRRLGGLMGRRAS